MDLPWSVLYPEHCLQTERGDGCQGLVTRQDAVVRAEVRGCESCCWCQSCLV